MWRSNGGLQMLDSFETDFPWKIDSKYVNFMKSLDFYAEVDEYILVHAGLKFDAAPLENQKAQLWIRKWYPTIKYDWLAERIIVHGHTPISANAFEKQWEDLAQNQYLDIDTGCVFKEYIDLGRLAAFNLTDRTMVFQKNIEAA